MIDQAEMMIKFRLQRRFRLGIKNHSLHNENTLTFLSRLSKEPNTLGLQFNFQKKYEQLFVKINSREEKFSKQWGPILQYLLCPNG